MSIELCLTRFHFYLGMNVALAFVVDANSHFLSELPTSMSIKYKSRIKVNIFLNQAILLLYQVMRLSM